MITLFPLEKPMFFSDFQKKLKEIDTRLRMFWNPELEIYEVHELIKTAVPAGELCGCRVSIVQDVPEFVMRIQEHDGSFRVPDGRSLKWIRYNDIHRTDHLVRERLNQIKSRRESKEITSRNRVKEAAARFADFASFYGMGLPEVYQPLRRYA